MEPSPKRRKTAQGASCGQKTGPSVTLQSATHSSSSALTREISPPPIARRIGEHGIDCDGDNDVQVIEGAEKGKKSAIADASLNPSPVSFIPSPIHLIHVQGLAAANNVDCLSLKDLIGDPLIKECWAFNFLFDVDFLLDNLDEDVRSAVQVKLIHGFWKNEDPNRTYFKEQATKHANVEHITAYMPEMFGTHHTKMFVLIRHDDHAQGIIHTANLIPQDWRMCQAVWRSPLLPMKGSPYVSSKPLVMGSGGRFKLDLMSYLRAYERSRKSLLKSLLDQLENCDFDAVKAAFVASVPGRQSLMETESESTPVSTWGWPGLRKVLRQVPSNLAEESQFTMQVSSIATLGATDKWLKSAFLPSLSARKPDQSNARTKPKFSLIFPTADEIRRSMDGYGSGGSIHCKTQGATQEKQLQYLRPYLCHWAGDQPASSPSAPAALIREAGRRRTAPHIKTYMRFSDPDMTKLDWAMVTSANLSKQAWGAEANAAGDVRICSYEVGVVVWPGLFGAGNERVEMVPVFKKDLPTGNDCESGVVRAKTVVGLRMPYDLPLAPYAKTELPWCASAPDPELDCMGRAWPGFGTH